MILQQLYSDAKAILGELPPPMYDMVRVHWQIDVSADGKSAKNPIPLPKDGPRRLVPYNYGRAVDVIPNLLVDTADYALGLPDSSSAKKHETFLNLLKDCADKTGDAEVLALYRFLLSGGLPANKVPKEMKPKERVAFRVGGKDPAETPAVRRYWDEINRAQYKFIKDKPVGRCLVTGLRGPIERILPCEVQIGGESAPLISVNEASGCSYGLEQALNGSVSRDAAEGFTKALTALMRGDKTHVRFGDGMYVFWTKTGAAEDVQPALVDPDAQLVRKLILSAQSGDRAGTTRLDVEPFYGVSMSGNKTRVVFRSWISTTLPEVRSHLARWFKAQEVTPLSDGPWRPMTVGRIAASAFRDSRKEEKPFRAMATALVDAALTGSPVPRTLLARAIGRCRVERKVTQARASLLKLALTIKENKMAEELIDLDESRSNPAYVSGRLLALLDNIQYKAVGSVNSSIVDRFFGAAAANPKRILWSVLLKKAQTAHLPKLRKQQPGAFFHLDRQLADITGTMTPDRIPASLSLEQQAEFMLGFYHQKAHTFAVARKKTSQGDNGK